MPRGRPPRLSLADKHELRRYREAGVAISHLAGMWKISTTRVYEILAEMRARLGEEHLPANKQYLQRRHLFRQVVPDSSPTSGNSNTTSN